MLDKPNRASCFSTLPSSHELSVILVNEKTHVLLCGCNQTDQGWFTRTTQAQHKHKHKTRVNRDDTSTSARSFSLRLCWLASSQFTRGLCLCLRRTCKPALHTSINRNNAMWTALIQSPLPFRFSEPDCNYTEPMFYSTVVL